MHWTEVVKGVWVTALHCAAKIKYKGGIWEYY